MKRAKLEARNRTISSPKQNTTRVGSYTSNWLVTTRISTHIKLYKLVSREYGSQVLGKLNEVSNSRDSYSIKQVVRVGRKGANKSERGKRVRETKAEAGVVREFLRELEDF